MSERHRLTNEHSPSNSLPVDLPLDYDENAAAISHQSRNRRRMRLQAAKSVTQDKCNDKNSDDESNIIGDTRVRTISSADEEEEGLVYQKDGRVGDIKLREIIDSAFGPNADLYGTVLKVPRDSYEEKLRRAYFHRALEFQTETLPDTASIEDVRDCGLKNRAVALAYKILNDDDCRKLYDTRGILTLQPSRYLNVSESELGEDEKDNPRNLRKKLLDKTVEEDDNQLEHNQSKENVDVSEDSFHIIVNAFGEDTCNLYKHVLRVPKTASNEDIRKAYCMRAMFYHPSRQVEGVTQQQAHIASLRFRAITIAYKVLSNHLSREQYDKFGTINVVNERDDEPLSNIKSNEESTFYDESHLDDIQPQMKALIDEAFGQDADLYDIVLRVPKNSSKKEIHEGYLRRAMFYHPGRHANKNLSQDQVKKASICFRAVTIAYQTLSDEKLKTAYDRTGKILRRATSNVVKLEKAKNEGIRNVFLPTENLVKSNEPHFDDKSYISTMDGESK